MARFVNIATFGMLALFIVGILAAGFWMVGTPVFLRHHILSLLIVDALFIGLSLYALLGALVSRIWPALAFDALFSVGALGLTLAAFLWFPHTAAFVWWTAHVRSRAVLICRGWIALIVAGGVLPRVLQWAAERC